EVKSGSITLATYTYNHQRQRTRKVTAQGTTVYHYDLSGNLIVETTSSGSLIRAYVWADNRPIAQISAGVPETLVYLHAHHLETPRLATNGSGTVVWSWEGEAFGGTLPNEDPDADGVATTASLRFPGQYDDEETGLHYNWNRYYHPGTGRYIKSDPVGLHAGLSTFSYTTNNPGSLVDRFGLDALPGLSADIREALTGHRYPPPTFPNGNYRPGFEPQIPGCHYFPGLNGCITQCCEEHDRCYEKHGCNASSWYGNRFGYDGACQECNAAARRCVLRNLANFGGECRPNGRCGQ